MGKVYRFILFGFFLVLPISVFSQAPVRVDASFEDSLRIVILWNNVEGLCEGTYTPLVFPLAGTDTRDFVIRSVDTSRIRHVRIFQSATFSGGLRYPAGSAVSATTLSQVRNAFGPGKYPHVIVHINAGHTAFDGPEMKTILSWAVENRIGVVEIGDDGATLAESVFGIKNVDNFPLPMEDAIWLDKPGDSLKIHLHPERDPVAEPSQYPHLKGLVTNAYNLNSRSKDLVFKPFENGGRCQGDADIYITDAQSKNKLIFLGYEQGYSADIDSTDKTSDKIVGIDDQFNVIVLLQEKSADIVRSGVILSFQPQFLVNEIAAGQLVYDAIIYSALTRLNYNNINYK